MRGERFGAVGEQGVFVGRDLIDAELVDVIQRGAESDAAGDVGRAGFELVRQVGVGGLLEGDHLDHVAAALIGRHGVEQRGLAVEDADAGGAEDLVAAEGVEIGVERLQVHLHVGRGLRAIDQRQGAGRVRHLDDLA